ncbi:DNA helicase UvrBC [Treponema sp. OMZ 840]
MICDLCGRREAVVFVRQISTLGKKEVHLCEVCAKAQGIDASTQTITMNLENLINGVHTEKKVCSVCGRSIYDIRKTGQAGCPECYAAFKEEIQGMLTKKGIDLPYTGSMPKKLAYFRSMLTDRMAIQTKLKDSLAREDYEKAAMYRDFLKALESPAVTGADEH